MFSDREAFDNPVVQGLDSSAPSNISLLSMGFVGAVVSGVVIKMLRQNGYQMF